MVLFYFSLTISSRRGFPNSLLEVLPTRSSASNPDDREHVKREAVPIFPCLEKNVSRVAFVSLRKVNEQLFFLMTVYNNLIFQEYTVVGNYRV